MNENCKETYGYKEVKNYIHNDLGISKEYIRSVLHETLSVEVNKLLRDESYMNNIVKQQIREVMNTDFEKPMWKRIFNLDTEVYNAVCNEVSNMVKCKLELRFKEGDMHED